MRLATLAIALIACPALFAQNQPADPSHKYIYTMFRIRDGFRVVVDDRRVLDAIATSFESIKPSGVVRFKGNVEIKLDGVDLFADEVDYHLDTGELEPLGNVRLKPIAPPEQ
jgi:lipopolysaccharide assembly outer membrane protein LptD (OstA)